MVNKNWVLISKIQDIAATRAFMLRVAKKEGWNVATDIRDFFDKDPIEAFFKKICLVPDSWQKISLRIDTKPEASVLSFLIHLENRFLLAL
ncbi:44724_t:CDS:1, partial [Gigaspora margarita]